MHETVTKLSTEFGKLYLHLSWDLEKSVAAGFSISHQQRDFDSAMVKALDDLSQCLNRPAMLKNPTLLKQILEGLNESIAAGP